MLDQLNLLNWWLSHQDKYAWVNGASQDQIAACAVNTQTDLDTIASCASATMNNPAKASMPADFALSLGSHYPLSRPMPTAPTSKGPAPVVVPNWVGTYVQWVTIGGTDQDGVSHPSAASLGLRTQVTVIPNPGHPGGDIARTDPSAGSSVLVGDTVMLYVYDDN
jgi:hypothetical protein